MELTIQASYRCFEVHNPKKICNCSPDIFFFIKPALYLFIFLFIYSCTELIIYLLDLFILP